MAQCQEPRAQIRLVFGLRPYLAGKYCEKLKVPGAQLHVNPARAITWFTSVTIYCTFFSNNNSPPPRQFLCNKIVLKKLTTVTGMLIEQNFELRGPGPLGLICTPITDCFHDKAIIYKKNVGLDCYLLLKYCRRQCTLLPFNWAKSQNLTPKCKILNVFWP